MKLSYEELGALFKEVMAKKRKQGPLPSVEEPDVHTGNSFLGLPNAIHHYIGSLMLPSDIYRLCEAMCWKHKTTTYQQEVKVLDIRGCDIARKIIHERGIAAMMRRLRGLRLSHLKLHSYMLSGILKAFRDQDAAHLQQLTVRGPPEPWWTQEKRWLVMYNQWHDLGLLVGRLSGLRSLCLHNSMDPRPVLEVLNDSSMCPKLECLTLYVHIPTMNGECLCMANFLEKRSSRLRKLDIASVPLNGVQAYLPAITRMARSRDFIALEELHLRVPDRSDLADLFMALCSDGVPSLHTLFLHGGSLNVPKARVGALVSSMSKKIKKLISLPAIMNHELRDAVVTAYAPTWRSFPNFARCADQALIGAIQCGNIHPKFNGILVIGDTSGFGLWSLGEALERTSVTTINALEILDVSDDADCSGTRRLMASIASRTDMKMKVMIVYKQARLKLMSLSVGLESVFILTNTGYIGRYSLIMTEHAHLMTDVEIKLTDAHEHPFFDATNVMTWFRSCSQLRTLKIVGVTQQIIVKMADGRVGYENLRFGTIRLINRSGELESFYRALVGDMTSH